MARKVSVGTKPGEERTFKVVEMDITMCWCPKGKFVMGSPEDEAGHLKYEEQVSVDLSHGFWMGKYEVTQRHWDDVMKEIAENPSKSKGATLPVENVSYDEAAQFCETLTKLARDLGQLPDDWAFRLPTEAEWECACRARTETAYSFGDDPQQLGDYAWYGKNLDGKTHPVGEKKPNGWGLCDMHGNVWEWCRDGYQVKLPGGTDPEAKAASSAARVVRGGSWFNSASFARVAFRSGNPPSKRDSRLGFRCSLVQVSPDK